MTMAGDRHTPETAVQTITVCRCLLNKLDKAIQHRKWSMVSQVTTDYSERIRLLGEVDHADSNAELIQLEIRHRRCMRMLSRHMKAVAEDISSLEAGQASALRSQNMAKTISH